MSFSQHRRALESVGCTRDVKERKRDNERKRPKKFKQGEQALNAPGCFIPASQKGRAERSCADSGMMALSIFYFPSCSVSRSDVERAAEQIGLYRETTIVEQLELYREAWLASHHQQCRSSGMATRHHHHRRQQLHNPSHMRPLLGKTQSGSVRTTSRHRKTSCAQCVKQQGF